MSRITDYLRERRIDALSRNAKALMAAGRTDEGRIAYGQALLECRKRSPKQVARMERAQYLRLSPADRKIFDRSKGAE